MSLCKSLLVCFLPFFFANVLASQPRDEMDATSLYQRGMHLQGTDGVTQPQGAVAEEVPVHLAPLRSSAGRAVAAGPKTITALKMAMHKVEGLPAPDYVLRMDLHKEALSRVLKSSFKDLVSATEPSWLVSDGEWALIEKRFAHKAWELLTPALHESPRAQTEAYWLSFWAQAKRAFVRVVFNDDKVLSKPEIVNKEELVSMEEIVTKPRLRKRTRKGAPEVFTVRTGHCTVDAEGCLLSPNYPLNYTNRGTCIISVDANHTGPLEVKLFSTESMVDILVVNGVRYSGEVGPEGIVPREDILWSSDYVLSGAGFRLCRTGEAEPKPEEEEVDTQTNFTVVEGNCTTEADCVMSTNYPLGYPNLEKCVINISAQAMTRLHVEEFLTEYVFDYLTVNGKSYSGTEGPEGVVPSGQMVWISDFSYANVGWKICTQSLGSELGPANNTVFTVRVGSCIVGADGCVSSPSYQGFYPNAGICTIGVNTSAAGPLYSERFSTELGYDVLTVDGMRFSGTHGPDGITPHEDIAWYSDFEAAADGWKICSGKPISEMSYPSHEGDDVDAFTTISGDCRVSRDGQCVSSPRYPSRCGHSETCRIEVSPNVTRPIRVADFNTEWQLDVLTVNGEVYSGISGPDGVVPTGEIVWTSDKTVRSAGWKICVIEPPVEPPGHMVWPTPLTTETTNTTTTTTTSTTTTTTTSTAPSVWDELSYHMGVSEVMVKALVALEAKSGRFEQSASLFKKALETLPAYVPQKESALQWYTSYVHSSVTGNLMLPWVEWLQEFQPAMQNVTAAVTSNVPNGPGLNDAAYLPALAESFRQKVRWLLSETLRQHNSMLEQTLEVLPSKLEALKVPMRAFREHLNNFLQHTHAALSAVPGYLADQVKEPFKYFGSGSCLDASGREYDTVESDACDPVMRCMRACRGIAACQGFTVKADIKCQKCELRIEEGGAVEADSFWHYAWKDGNGVGRITSTRSNQPGLDNTHCFRREPFATADWPDMMRKAVEEAQDRQVAKYNAAGELWDSIIFKIKSAFAKIMAAIEAGAREAVALEVKRQATAAESQ